MAVKDQRITSQYAIYCGDCVQVLPDIKSESVGYSVFSPPFCDLFCYSENKEDMGNSRTPDEFFKHFSYLTDELARVLMPGRCVSVHCADLPIRKQEVGYVGQYDFPGDLIRHFQSKDFIFHSRHVIWKDPLVLFMRTKTMGLAHKQIVSDSSLCRAGNPDYLITFRKKGVNPKPITHPEGLTEYHGARKVPKELERFSENDPKTNKKSHWIWQQYASPVWFDVRQMTVLPYRGGKEPDDEKHVCPLQLDVIERCITLWSAPGDVVLTPFMGIGSEVWVAVKNGRKGLGVELKARYFRQAVRNLESLKIKQKQKTFDLT